ncbi:AIPR family protein [Thalassovita sp.]|uniref:AIPR family protein n=1 Tax=Thalassovita sp. TaxID=1979401 RepID=UPI002881F4EF|nr:AIPR family protein [Thalassovita sp.]MDF1803015.1 AIPR family protein [Thalassovita sp.]
MSANAKRILGDIVEQRRQESMPDLSLQDFFEVFSAEQITKDYALNFEELEASIVDGEHDGGVDSVFIFVNGDLILEDTNLGSYKKNVHIDLIVIQSKTSGGFSEDPINRIKSTLEKLLDLTADYGQLNQYNQEVKSAFDRFRNTYRTLASRFPRLRIEIKYAAMAADSEIHTNLLEKGKEIVATVQSMFDEASVDFSFLGAKELLALARQRPNQTFSLGFSKSLSGDNGYVVLTLLKDFNSFLRNGGDAVRSDLFESNVRDYQGSTEVNSEISETLLAPTDVDFWWLNNGVTILSSQATQTGGSVTIENPQIVNGLQTSSQIAKFFNEGGSDDNRMVMVKIVSSEDEVVRDQIIKATNSQNTVPRASLRATDKVQRDIEHTLKMGGYFYDRRKNFYKNQGRPAGKIVSIPLLAQAMMTLLRGEPDNARARPSSLIKDDDVYNSLFSEDHPVDAYLVAADLIKRVETALKARATYTAQDRNNLRFYCLYWIMGWECKSSSLTASKISARKNFIFDPAVEAGIDKVASHFFAAGGNDQLAKGPDFKATLTAQLDVEIKAHFLKETKTTASE